MSRVSIICAAVLAMLIVGVTAGEELPNFSGRWTLAGAGSHPEQPLIVRQTATSLSVENWASSGPSREVYVWSTNSRDQGSATPLVSWRGTTLVVVFPPAKWPAFPGAVTVRTESWSLDRTGKLVVEIDYTRSPQRPPIVHRFVYTRSESP